MVVELPEQKSDSFAVYIKWLYKEPITVKMAVLKDEASFIHL